MEPVGKNKSGNEEEKDWEDPLNPEAPADARDREQLERQLREAERINKSLTGTDEPDDEKKD